MSWSISSPATLNERDATTSAHGHHGDFGRTSSDIHNHRAAYLPDRQARRPAQMRLFLDQHSPDAHQMPSLHHKLRASPLRLLLSEGRRSRVVLAGVPCFVHRTFPMKYSSMTCVTSNSEITPSRIGRTTMNCPAFCPHFLGLETDRQGCLSFYLRLPRMVMITIPARTWTRVFAYLDRWQYPEKIGLTGQFIGLKAKMGSFVVFFAFYDSATVLYMSLIMRFSGSLRCLER